MVVEAIELVSWYLLPTFHAAKSPTATLIRFAVACVTGPAIDIGAKRPYSWLPSSIFLVLGGIGDISSLRVHFLGPSAHFATGIMLSAACCRATLLLIQLALPRQIPAESAEITKPYHSWHQELCELLQSTILCGFRNITDVEALGTLSPELDPERLAKLFDEHWQAADKTSEHCLLDVCKKVLQSSTYPGIVAKNFGSLFVYTQPFLLEHIIVFFEQPLPEFRTRLVLSTAIAFTGSTVSTAVYNRICDRTHIALNGMLSLVVIRKLGRLGQNQALTSATPSLIDEDVASVCDGIQAMYRAKNDAIHIALGMAVLFKFAGSGSLVAATGIMISTSIQALVSSRVKSTYSAWTTHNQEKTTKTAEVLSQLQIIKALGLQSVLADKLRKLQATEFELWLKAKSANFPHRIAQSLVDNGMRAFLVLYLYLLHHGEIGPRLIFPSLAVSFEVKKALELYVGIIRKRPVQFESLKRVQEYLLQREVVEHRIHKPSPHNAIECIDLAIAPEGAETPLLHSINCSIPKGTVTLALGPSCSGKSTFLQALAGSAEILQGSISLHSTTLAYCDQVPWLQNASIKENIITGSQFNEDRYQTVLRLCLLSHDLEKLEQGDEYVVGHNGMNLSGGQRHRIVSIVLLGVRVSQDNYAHQAFLGFGPRYLFANGHHHTRRQLWISRPQERNFDSLQPLWQQRFPAAGKTDSFDLHVYG